jgi:two-component system sensor kinase FixL
MKANFKIALLFVLIATTVWLGESLVDALLFAEGPGPLSARFLSALSPSPAEIFDRLFFIIVLFPASWIVVTLWLKREKAEKARVEKALRLAQFSVDNASEAMIWVDSSARIKFVNKKACSQLGYSREELTSMSVPDIDPWYNREVWPGHWEELKREGSMPFESRHKRKDGTTYPMEISANYVNFEGEELNFAFIRDITERKKAEEALRRSEEKFRAIFNNAQVGMFRTRIEDGLFLEANDRLAEIGGWPGREAMVGKIISSMRYVDPGERDRMVEELRRTGAVRNFEARMYRMDGTVMWMRLSARLNAKEGYLEGVLTDITEQKTAEEELIKYKDHLEELVEARTGELKKTQEKLIASERLAVLGQFSGIISHEIRNPLGAIGSSVYYLKRRMQADDEKTQSHLEKIQAQVDICTGIIDSVLKLTRMDLPSFVPCDLVQVLASHLDLSTVPGNIRVEMSLPDGPVMVTADQSQLILAFENIIKNAVQAMPDGGTLGIGLKTTAKEQSLSAEIRFSDTGPGIPPENLDKIFQPLFTTKATGIGFGLSIVKMVMERHGGKVDVESSPPTGTTFIVRLPILSDFKDEETE